jgi:WD40-like Beta Propeller Repeat
MSFRDRVRLPRKHSRLSASWSAALAAAVLVAVSTAPAAVTATSGSGWSSGRVSVTSGGAQLTHGMENPRISSDGQHVMFWGTDPALNVPGSGDTQVFVRDLAGSGTTEQVSVDNAGLGGGRASRGGGLSSGGRYATFVSYSTLSADDLNGSVADVYVRDRTARVTELISASSAGVQGNDTSGEGSGAIGDASISADGRWVAFASQASNLAPGDTNGVSDVFLRDRANHTTERISVATAGTEANGASYWVKISADGTTVAFISGATNLVAGDANGQTDAFVHDRVTGVTDRVSVGSLAVEANGASFYQPAISGNGSMVAFVSSASNLVPSDTNGAWDAFVRNRATGATERVSVGVSGAQAVDNTDGVAISSDGGVVAFGTEASFLGSDPGGRAGGAEDVYVRNRVAATTDLVSRTPSATAGNAESGRQLNGDGIDIDALGTSVTFHSNASDLVVGDTNGTLDVFVARFGPTAPAAVAVTPPDAVNTVATNHTVTATVTTSTGAPFADASVLFATAGSTSASGSCTTAANGECSFTYLGPQLPGADIITACADSNKNGSVDAAEPCAEATKAWILPTSTTGQTTGGGQILNSAGNDKIAFGYNAKSTASGLSGNCSVVDPSPVTNVKLKCLDVSSIVQTGTHATFFGNATVNGVAATYRVDVEDLGEPGIGHDTFKIQTSSGYAASGTLTNGNLQVHN